MASNFLLTMFDSSQRKCQCERVFMVYTSAQYDKEWRASILVLSIKWRKWRQREWLTAAHGLRGFYIWTFCHSVGHNLKPCDWSVWLGLRGWNWESSKLEPKWNMQSKSCALIGQYKCLPESRLVIYPNVDNLVSLQTSKIQVYRVQCSWTLWKVY
jgi:hypothetical protein